MTTETPTDASALDHAVPGPDDATTQRLIARLAAGAADQDLLDVAYRTMDCPLGPVLLATTPIGLVRLAYAVEDHDAVLQDLAARVSPRVLHAPKRLDLAATEVDEYFAGRRRAFDLPLDLRLSTGFRRTVLAHLQEVPYGSTATYTSLALAAGNPKAVRAVGSACATNPVPIVVPCHRVTRSDGSVGQYLGGAQAKKALLAMEAAAVRDAEAAAVRDAEAAAVGDAGGDG